jgi:Sulfocyanin (SoxE) domain
MARLGAVVVVGAVLICVASCDPVMGTGPGTPPDPTGYMRADTTARTVVVTLIAGYPAGDYQFNYDGYGSGSLVVTVPVGWQVTVQCENRGTVPNSCAVVSGRSDMKPIEPGWSTPDPVRGLDPGQSASFSFSPANPGSYRIASLVGGNEASGMWADLEVTAGGNPAIAAPFN